MSTAGEDFPAARPLVLGSDGRAGRAIVRELTLLAPQTVAATRTELDICDYFGLRWEFERLEVDLVINAAGWSDVDGCQARPAAARSINGEGAGHAARAAHQVGARFVHLSCEHVFDGRKGSPYVETDTPVPLSEYARSKLEGEERVRSEHADALIVRTAWLYGGPGSQPDPLARILDAALQGVRLTLPADRLISPTAADDLARNLLLLLGFAATGVVHLAGSGQATPAEFARSALSVAGFEGELVADVSQADVHSAAPLPADGRLDCGLFQHLTGVTPRDWREALWDMIGKKQA